MYLCWRTLVGLNETLTLHFMVAGHTKNIVDGAFGHIKRKLVTKDVRTPSEMMDLISESSENTHCVPAVSVSWALWKNFLSRYFKIPVSFAITKFHVFKFCHAPPGVLHAKEFTNSTEEKTYSFFKNGVGPDDVQREAQNVFSKDEFRPVISRLAEVKSSQHGTRHNYLVHNILNLYFSGDEEVRTDFFREGTGK